MTCPVCCGTGGYYGEKECFVEVGKAWKRCERIDCQAAQECRSTEQVWATCWRCYGAGEIQSDSRSSRVQSVVRGTSAAKRVTADGVLAGRVSGDRTSVRVTKSKHLKVGKAKQRFHKRNGKRCWYCGVKVALNARAKTADETIATVDHQKPQSLGGRNHNNRVTACRRCNQTKAALTVEEYRIVLMRERGQHVKFYGEVA